MTRALPSLEVLRDLFLYDADTGMVTRRRSVPGKGSFKGALVGTPNSCGHLICRVNYQICYVHRIAWKLHYGSEPPPIIDHVNGAQTDNRITNMRAATCSQNGANRGVGLNNKSGLKGVSFSRAENKWKAGIKSAGRTFHLGYFKDKEAAGAAYARAAAALHGEFARAA